MVGIKIIGRGGQGGKTLSYLIALAGFKEGLDVQAFPDFGPEREGAPVFSYTRLSDKPIRVHYGIKEPDFVIVLDETLAEELDILDGIVEDGTVIINSKKIPNELKDKRKDVKFYCIDATGISVEELGRNMPNTPMLGAFAGVFDIKLKTMEKVFREEFSNKLTKDVLQKNIKVMRRAYKEVKQS